VLSIDMLPGGNGDALWIEYGSPTAPRRVLIDGGTGPSWTLTSGLHARIEALAPDDRHFELLIVTHVDGDHIDGALALLQDDTLGVSFGEVWFNGWRHLPDTPLESFGPVAGEKLTDAILTRAIPWNAAFGGRAVVVRPDQQVATHTLVGDLKLTVLSPTPTQLADLKPVWEDVLKDAGLDPERPRPTPVEPAPGLEAFGPAERPDVEALAALRFEQDTAEANGSSIVVLIEHEKKTALLTGDCFPSVVRESLRQLPGGADGTRRYIDAVKVPHHGSRFNVSLKLLEALESPRYLFSTDGSHTKHPHLEGVARTLVAATEGMELSFNYRSRFNEMWDDDELREKHHYTTRYPPTGSEGLRIEL
jgi:hypothetical protein